MLRPISLPIRAPIRTPAAVAANLPLPLPNWAPSRPPAAAPPRPPMVCLVPYWPFWAQAAVIRAISVAASTVLSLMVSSSLKDR